jgi:exopolysaccharide biosynthesis polyprenyl glycosylphosphotransferase
MLHRQSLNYLFGAIIFDLAGTLLALHLGHLTHERLNHIHQSVPFTIALLTLSVWSLIFFTLSVYDPARNYRAVDEFQNVIVAAVYSWLVFTGILYFVYHHLAQQLIAYFFAIDLLWLIGWRVVSRVFSRLYGGRRSVSYRVLIVGANGVGHDTSKQLESFIGPDLTIVGYVDDTPDEQVPDGYPVLGSLDEVCDIVEKCRIDEVVIALSYRFYEKLDQIVVDLQELPVQVRIVPNYFNLALYRATVEDFGGIPLINLRDPALSPYQRMIKRAFDLIVGSTATLLALPIMGVIAVAIRLDSAGPILFKQTRVGENGRLFTMFKFRSMVVDADKLQSAVMQYDQDGNPVHKVQNDPRVTRVGQIIRQTSLDELPQLFNVLEGTMTLVGPRPELPWLVERYEPWQRKRFAVPQGITGWWQITGRDEKLMHLHTEDDLYYIQNYSLLLDLQILWKTVGVVLKRKGAF